VFGQPGQRRQGAQSQNARILSAVMTRRVPDKEAEAFKQTPATPARRIFNLQKQVAKFGLQLLPAS